MDVSRRLLQALKDVKLVSSRLKIVESLGLGYLTFRKSNSSLSGGEAQRLKLVSEIGAHPGRFCLLSLNEPHHRLTSTDVADTIKMFSRL